MPKKPTTKMRPDVNETAYRVMMEATGQAPKTVPGQSKNPDAVKRGAKGGKARATKLTPAKRSEIARKGGRAKGR
jgi:hypothetical protein